MLSCPEVAAGELSGIYDTSLPVIFVQTSRRIVPLVLHVVVAVTVKLTVAVDDAPLLSMAFAIKE